MKTCPWETIDDFQNLSEFSRFVEWITQLANIMMRLRRHFLLWSLLIITFVASTATFAYEGRSWTCISYNENCKFGFTYDARPVLATNGTKPGAPAGRAVFSECPEFLGGGNYLGYQSVNEADEVQYVGITSDFETREAAHLAGNNGSGVSFQIEPIEGLNNLSLDDARAAEQTLIDTSGTWKKRGLFAQYQQQHFAINGHWNAY